eukprot:scaffold269620_cov40-Prasinocladus_malaysianus.AAC.1
MATQVTGSPHVSVIPDIICWMCQPAIPNTDSLAPCYMIFCRGRRSWQASGFSWGGPHQLQ